MQGAKEAGVIAQRVDLAGAEAWVALTGERTPLTPGWWQFTARPPAGSYLADIKASSRVQRREPHPEWFELNLEFVNEATVNAPTRAARLSGKAAVGAPVYLLPVSPLARRQMNGARTTRADKTGIYRFDSLAPGNYLVLSSYDVAEMTEEAMMAGQAKPITIEEGRAMVVDFN
jgi:hypothetical protein